MWGKFQKIEDASISFLSWSFGVADDLFMCPASTWAGQKKLERDGSTEQENRSQVTLVTHKGMWVSYSSVGITEAWGLGQKTQKQVVWYFNGGRSRRFGRDWAGAAQFLDEGIHAWTNQCSKRYTKADVRYWEGVELGQNNICIPKITSAI